MESVGFCSHKHINIDLEIASVLFSRCAKFFNNCEEPVMFSSIKLLSNLNEQRKPFIIREKPVVEIN